MCKRKSIDTSVDDRSTAKYTLLVFVSKDGAPNQSDNILLLMHGSKLSMIICFVNAITLNRKNSKVFEQKGDLLNLKANIDPMAVLSQAEPS